MHPQTFLMPVLVLIGWTLLIWVWMYIKRIPAMTKARISPQDAVSPRGSWKSKLPDHVNWVADNYNHLHEQPTIFYALMVTMFLMGKANITALWIAWIYIALRVLHSLCQIIGNRVMIRFVLFFASSVSLIALAVTAIF